ncbi:MAG: TolC family outer membrane protein [Rhizobiaceae bacterium]|nr:TolC family outer membrane protein [Rhizobiaceae bacterium]
MGGSAHALTLKEAISEALTTNPEILQAAENREATEFELRQARGLYLPSIDLEASAGIRRLDSPSSRRLGVAGQDLYPRDVGLSLTQTLFDGGARRAEVERQAARVDGASFRVLERSEAIALAVAQEYLEILVQAEIVAAAQQNVDFHRAILGDIAESVSGGVLTEADRIQGQERMISANARLTEVNEDLQAAKIRFNRLVGRPLTNASRPPSVARYIPNTLDGAIELARRNNPRVMAAGADVDAADAESRGADAPFFPKFTFEGRARVGQDIDGSQGYTSDLEAKVVARWNLYRGGRDVAAKQESIRRSGEQRYALAVIHRQVEEAVREAWNQRGQRAELAGLLRDQAGVNAQLVSSYREQFRVGERSLLDVLGAQNTRFNAAILSQTAAYAALFAEYRLLAATGSLASTMGSSTVEQGDAYAREEFRVQSVDAPDYRRLPSRQRSSQPLDLLAPIRKE